MNFKQDKVKPRMKVEYVKVEDSIFSLQPDLIAGELFLKTFNGKCEVISKEDCLAYAVSEKSLYRKVETEIKTEKRWLGVIVSEGRGVTTSLFKDKETCELHFSQSYQIIEITVEV